ncbi:efflux RND transporter periplasmic adaptor subunit [Anaeromyxobacter paludicola]|uniref:RND transporter n=1 Tax=Anaeromyxobacter paludicola TaxID=2918171 RepID=A0ABN6NAD8_9BACT|nr:efflux RND transporter periplasmic adaptor subunit [Anaeromyxobacter paludicola]BDG09310.1 RND transporter [Anaeromyxobacter paludicola]
MPTKLLVAAALAAALTTACSKGSGSAPRTRPPPSVTVARPQVRDVPVEVKAPVDLRPIVQADLGSKVLGYLDAVFVDRGDRVKKGQLLALVRPADLPDQLTSARGALAQAQASVDLARANKERAERLAPSGVVSQQELQQNVTALATAEAARDAARANVAALAVKVGETRIESPLDGYVSVRKLDPGALVGSSTGPILTVTRIDVLRVFVPVNERDVTKVQLGQDAHVELDAVPGRSYRGKVVRLSPGFDPVARTLDAEVHLQNPGELRAGMYGRGAIVTDVHPAALVLAASSVQLSGGKQYAFVLRGEKVKRVEVQTGVDGGDWLEVTSGLAKDDEVVTAGADVLSDGAAVRAQRNVDPFTGQAVTAERTPSN